MKTFVIKTEKVKGKTKFTEPCKFSAFNHMEVMIGSPTCRKKCIWYHSSSDSEVNCNPWKY